MFIFIGIYIFIYSYKYKDYYEEELNLKVNNIIEGDNAPRGRILDINGNVLVDNKQINNLSFHYVKGINILDVAYKLSNIIKLDNPSDNAIIKYYKKVSNEYNLLTDKEKEMVKYRKLSGDKLNNIIDERILSSVNYTNEELNIISIYDVLTSGYLYDTKLIISDIDDILINKILSIDIPGISITNSYIRIYPYGESLKSIFGSVGKIQKENRYDYPLTYDLDDYVGISYLEKEYEQYLRGTKAKYKVNSDYSLTLISEEIRGNDLYLSIDINMQQKLESIIDEELIIAKKRANTKYLTDSYAVLTDPNTGAIRAISGRRYISDDNIKDITINTISSSFTLGSVVKGATISVGLKYNLIDPDKKILDGCVKLYSQMPKCSWERLGYIDAYKALEQSSNYYQFIIALKLMGYNYTYNMNVNANINHFNIYRQMLASYGLGVKSNIELPNETEGLKGNKITTDLLLNLAIGQYDAYTPIMLSNYMSTLAMRGKRHASSLVNKIVDINNNTIYQNNYDVISNVELDGEDYDVIIKGFKSVMSSGTGWGSFNLKLNPAGKTGTSESFLDSDNDGIVDTATTTLTLGGFFPVDNPKYSLVVVSPHASFVNKDNDYTYYISAHIARKYTDYIYENNL